MIRQALALTLLLAGASWQPALAHQRSESFSQWRWDGDGGTLELRFTVAAREAGRIAQGESIERLPGILAAYLRSRVGPVSNDNNCQVSEPLSARLAANGFVVASASWQCNTVPPRIFIAAFFDIAPEHAHLAALTESGHTLQRYVHSEDTDWEIAVELESKGVESAHSGHQGWARLFQAAGLGVRHALSGVDHLAFLLALLLVCRRMSSIVWAITGFTIGHSVSLTLAALGLWIPVIPAVEATIGLTIALVAAERLGAGRIESVVAAFMVVTVLVIANLSGNSAVAATGIAGLAIIAFCYLLLSSEVGDSGLFRMGATVLFGLIHGLGYATAYQVIGLPTSDVIWSLAGFNIGVELGQVLAVILALVASRAVVRIAGPRPLAADFLAAGVCTMGVFWFASRSIGG